MSSLRITDEDRAAWRAEKQTGFAATLQETMQATGAAPKPAAPEPITARPFGRREIAMIVAAMATTMAAIALLGRGSAQPVQPAPAVAPAATRAPATATVAPTVTPSPTALPTATPAPPTPEPEVIYIEVAPPCDPAINPLYSVQLDVYSDDRRPLGQVVGVSCDSQAAAQANAEQLAVELRGE